MSPVMRPKSFGTFEKRTPELLTSSYLFENLVSIELMMRVKLPPWGDNEALFTAQANARNNSLVIFAPHQVVWCQIFVFHFLIDAAPRFFEPLIRFSEPLIRFILVLILIFIRFSASHSSLFGLTKLVFQLTLERCLDLDSRLKSLPWAFNSPTWLPIERTNHYPLNSSIGCDIA